jgi:anthranilate synthase component 2
MGLAHRTEPVFGVQFHPESVGTEVGMRIIESFLRIVSG